MSHPTPDQLTDAALPGMPVDPEVAAHVDGCDACAAELAALRRTVGHARDGMTLDTAPPPRPEVWDGLLARLGADAPETPSPAPAPAAPAPAPRRARRRLLGAGVGALVAVAAAAVAIVLATPPATPPATRPATPTAAPPVARVALVAAQPGVAGEVVGERDGVHVEVVLAEPAPAGAGLEVWDMAGGTPRSLGALQPIEGRTHWTGDLALPRSGAVPPLDVSLEPAGSDPGHSGLSLAHTP